MAGSAVARVADLDGEEFEPDGLRTLNIDQLLAMSPPPRDALLEPIIMRQSLVMFHGWRGSGKSWISVGIAYALACGGPFLRWHAPKPRRVLFIDGELPLTVLQERFAAAVASQEGSPPDPTFLHVITPDAQDEPIPNLADPIGQAALDVILKRAGAEVLILDNLSTLTSAIAENENDAWGVVQSWLLGLRRRGLTVILIHHSGKNGAQRGASRREDVLDVTIGLRHPDDYSPAEGCRIELHFEKNRGLHGDVVKPFEAKLEVIDGASTWTTRDLDEVLLKRAAELYREGFTVSQVESELRVSRGTAGRLRKKAAAQGLL